MKIRLSRKTGQMASALLVVMVLAGILCLSVVYYLALVEQQNKLSTRSQAWNIAIAISEAGVEEALQAVNSSGIPSSADGWQLLADGCYWRTNTLPDGNRYEVSVHLARREIVSRGFVGLPALAANSPSTYFAAAGVPTANTGPAFVTRAVRVRYLRGGFFLGALIAKYRINLKGNNALTDSFDSESLWKSYYGQYDPTVYTGDKGDIASNDSVIDTIGIGNAEIYGKAHTGPEGTVAIGQGWVGPHPKGAKGGHAEGWILQDANYTFPDTWLPYNSGLPLGVPEDIVTVTYEYLKSATNSSVYPNPVPWSGVITNVTYTTNTVPWTSWAYPEAGTYVPPVQQINDSEGNHWFKYLRITGYTPHYTYYYNLYTTNAIYMTNHYDHVIRSGDYYTTEAMTGSTIVLGKARLVLANGLVMKGNDGIVIAPTGSLEVYAGGTECTIGGNGINNQAGFAKDFILECTPTVTKFTYNGNGEFIGVLVAPEADMQLNGAGSSLNDFIGCIMMKSIDMNGHYCFHYDEALARLNTNRRVLITSWNEIR